MAFIFRLIDEIYQIQPAGQGQQGRTGWEDVKSNLGTGAPVGNLYSDGLKIWVLGANRVYALGAKVANRSASSEGD